MQRAPVAVLSGAAGAAVALFVLDGVSASRFPPSFLNRLRPEVATQLKTSLLFSQIPTAISVGVACAFLLIVLAPPSRLVVGDWLSRSAIAGLTWILVIGFVQAVLLYSQVNVSSVPANLFWAGTRLLAIAAVLAFVVRALEPSRPGTD